MFIKLIKKIILRTAFISAICIGFLTAVSAADTNNPTPLSIRRVIVFGDSLSDNGNLYDLTLQLHAIKNDIPIIPSPTLYWKGRFSDGPVWNEYLASMLHFMPNQINSESRESEQFKNFSYAGSWAETTQPDGFTYTLNSKPHSFPPPLSTQIDTYIAKNKALDPDHYQQTFAHDLVFIWAGGNDYLNQDFNGPPVMRSPNLSTDYVMRSIRKNLIKLIDSGLKNFVIIGLPDLSKIPDIELRDPQHQSLVPNLSITSQLHNEKLKQLVADFHNQYPQLNFIFMDVSQLFSDQFRQSLLRQHQYALLHNGQFQKISSPCIIEDNDPDPNIVKQFHLSHILAMAVSPRNKLRFNVAEYPHCDLHTAGDQRSPFNLDQAYTAGGIFFDHIHPITHIHAIIALKICRLLQTHGYTFFQPQTNAFSTIDCSQYDLRSLLHKIVDPPFPLA